MSGAQERSQEAADRVSAEVIGKHDGGPDAFAHRLAAHLGSSGTRPCGLQAVLSYPART
ncbi:hypothetical protein GCM10018771_39410 [Streptomyces cellulosae]|nr:hypothetical protein GCM10018771_39410 [Streptomyces cellulosae]